MRHLVFTALLVSLIVACSPNNQSPQSFEDLLTFTDKSDKSICTLPLSHVTENLAADDLKEFMTAAFEFDSISKTYENDFPTQIYVILRRAALKRRLNIQDDNIVAAEKYYAEFDDGIPDPKTMSEYHTKLHYWGDRLREQGSHDEPEADDYNLRFCIVNEARAKLHSDSRRFILSKVSDGNIHPDAEILENINHENFYGDGFKAYVMERLFADENMKGLTALERAMIRGELPILPSDPKTAEPFWDDRDAEIDVIQSHITTHDYAKPTTKLADMRMIDQSLRRLWSSDQTERHFQNKTELETFKKGISERVMKVDNFNTEEIKSMLEGRGWFRDDKDGEGASNAAWLIAQHADNDPEFQQEALKLIEAELGAPGVSKRNYAYLYDRVQMRFNDYETIETRLQRYGTQGRCSGPGTWEPLSLEDPENVDKRRAEVGLGPMAEYKLRFKSMCKEDQRR